MQTILCNIGHPIAKGIKIFRCLMCEKEGSNYVNGIDFCYTCRELNNLCAICGAYVPFKENHWIVKPRRKEH